MGSPSDCVYGGGEVQLVPALIEVSWNAGLPENVGGSEITEEYPRREPLSLAQRAEALYL
jgi:hypothetical protein